MVSRQLIVAAITSLVVLQLVVGSHLVTAGRTEGRVRPVSWSVMVKRSPGPIQRLWLSRGATSSLMNKQLRQLLDSPDDIDLQSEDMDDAVDGSRSMRYGR